MHPSPQSPPKQPIHSDFFLNFATSIIKPDNFDIVTLAISALHGITDMVQVALEDFTL